MGQQSLFGYMATRLTSQTENLATESLNYILNQSPVARQAFLNYLSQAVSNGLGSDLTFQTQVAGPDQARPDLIGLDDEGRPIVVIEAKFWAGLTEHQPVTYLARLPQSTGSILLFIAPARRFQTLWPELLYRCQIGNFFVEPETRLDNEFVIGRLDETRVLALVSWRSVLVVMLQALNAARDHETAADVIQLQGLCDRMDSEAFLPIRSEELASFNGIRLLQYLELISDITTVLKEEGLISTEGLRATSSMGWYGQYITIKKFAGLIQFNAAHWRDLRETPLWLSIKGPDWKYSKLVKELLAPLARERPPRLFRDNEWLTIPLNLPPGVERHQVLDSLLAQIREIAAYLKEPAGSVER